MHLIKNTKTTKSVRLFLIKFIVGHTILLAVIFTPLYTEAAGFSFFSDLFSGKSASAQTETYIESNSQNMNLLAAVNSADTVPQPASEIVIVGEEAILPEVGPLNNDPAEKINNSNGQISVYTVRSGDSFAKISKMFDVSVNTILWANDLNKNSGLKVGQELIILPMSGVLHTVVKGDTLSTIAKKYAGDVEEISLFNDFRVTDKLSVGQIIMIPDGEVSFSTRPSVVSSGNTTKVISSASAPTYDGYYQKPFTSGRRTQGIHGYNGVDYAMPVGSQIYAAASGTVLISKNSGWNGGYGNYIAIKHPNNTQTIYGHLSQALVSVGASVTQGQLIGYSGNTGKSTGPHLHFEVRGAKNPF